MQEAKSHLELENRLATRKVVSGKEAREKTKKMINIKNGGIK